MKRKLYTALYHAMLAPSLFMDRDGQYRGPDHEVHQADGFRFHSTFSLWDTYRALHPLLTMIQPEQRNADFVRSLIDSQKASPYGILPVWQFAGLETWCMIGYHAVPVIADAYMKGIKGFDADEALRAMTASAEYGPYGGLQHYMKLGYVPIDLEPEAASKTVEYAFDDWTIARMAEKMGKQGRRRALLQARPELAQCVRPEDRLRARAQVGRRVPRALRSGAVELRQRLHRGQRLAVFLVYAAR